MRSILLVSLVISLYSGSAIADMSAPGTLCGTNPLIERNFSAGITPIYYSTSAAAIYRVCSTGPAVIQLIIVNPNGTQTPLNVASQTCLDVSTTQLSVSVATATTDKSVFYCKIG